MDPYLHLVSYEVDPCARCSEILAWMSNILQVPERCWSKEARKANYQYFVCVSVPIQRNTAPFKYISSRKVVW